VVAETIEVGDWPVQSRYPGTIGPTALSRSALRLSIDLVVTIWHHVSALSLRAYVSVGQRLAADDENRGASLVEYALLVAFIALVCVAAVTLLGTTVEPKYSSVADGLD